MSTTWVVVAHRAGARILAHRSRAEGLSLVESMEHPHGRVQSHEMESDRPGRARFGAHGGAGAAFEQHDDPHDHDARVFARSIAARLDAGRIEHAFDALVLVAEPRFLGMLNEALDDHTRRLVRGSVQKDLFQVEIRDLLSHFEPDVLGN